ncbi:MBL fold metallo-hydrolase [Mycobacteroides abscessus]|uniref:MBL fold metallo-hydrolase n=1 Tax=Mycobacteroides abscessus TaxID=36809 RepID=UPI00266EAA89|nr:MBL fold metallo-hydrolase [Mycobacteroides abscessus]MDO3110860.1 MBL fold metallo-hydrolase [Mycobacteroides abscessus subsp. abscessus]
MTSNSGMSRRAALGIVGALGATAACACTAPSAPPTPRTPSSEPAEPTSVLGDGGGNLVQLTLLGTGAGPVYYPSRASMSTALKVGDRLYLVDAGLGAARRFRQAGFAVTDLTAVFITHLHPDHTADLYNILMYDAGGVAQRKSSPILVHGPGGASGLAPGYGDQSAPVIDPAAPAPGTKSMLEGALYAFRYGLNIFNTEAVVPVNYQDKWQVTDILPPAQVGASPTNTAPAMPPFPVYEDDAVRVSAILVPHGPVFPSYAYRFETDKAVVVFSGDTARSDNVALIAKDADVLIHEVIDVSYYQRTQPILTDHMKNHHTSPEDVGRVATQAGARSVILSHIGPGDPRDRSDDSWKAAVATTYAGPITVGQDLHRFGVDRKK